MVLAMDEISAAHRLENAVVSVPGAFLALSREERRRLLVVSRALLLSPHATADKLATATASAASEGAGVNADETSRRGYELILVGAAAFAAAVTAAEAGRRVALMEANVDGGTCAST